MNTKQRILRIYNLDDAAMLQFCYLTHQKLAKYQADFEAFDGRFTVQFVSDFYDSIKMAMDMETDGQLMNACAQSGMDVQEKMNECHNATVMLKYFVRKAFNNNPGIWSEFGFGASPKTRTNADIMIQFLTDIHQAVLKYQTELDAVGYGAIAIGQLLSLKNELQSLNTIKSQTKGTRYSSTHQRIETFNALWLLCCQICQAGKIIYNNNFGMYQMFAIPYRKTKKSVIDEGEQEP